MLYRRATRTVAALFLALVLALPGTLGAAPAAPTASGYVVVLRDDADAEAVAREHAGAHGFVATHVFRRALKGYAAAIPASRVPLIERDPRVAYVAVDRPVQATARPTPTPPPQTIPTGVDRIDADLSRSRATVGSVAVAILDTGIDPTHPDLNVAGGVNCSSGRDFADGNGHGTHVAGTVAARDDGFGVVGVAPGAPLYAVRVLNNAGSGTFASVICGIDWVTENAGRLGIRVANMSLSGTGRDDGNCGMTGQDPLHQAICRSVAAGVVYVVAAGNEGTDFVGSVPAAYDEVLTVTAVSDSDGRPGALGGAPACRSGEQDDAAASFSNFTQPGSVDAQHTIAAPGVCIQSTWKRGGYNTISGTSMATPHVAGTVALCIAGGACAGLTPRQIIARLRADAASRPASYGFAGDPNSPRPGRYYGHLVYAGGY